jgi:hypothetical protein
LEKAFVAEENKVSDLETGDICIFVKRALWLEWLEFEGEKRLNREKLCQKSS